MTPMMSWFLRVLLAALVVFILFTAGDFAFAAPWLSAPH
jgi:hypothetical protein